ncbi:hypothetical protein VTL71DRAFT_5416 [Oculimacula yallundae]|uniref:Uncharacterized protein n=1 Tax=Oculimacula yallundae TaxID=86028 RepID=A0ABR4C112_9HELO
MTGTVKWLDEWVRFAWQYKNAGKTANETATELQRQWPRGGKTFTSKGVQYALRTFKDPSLATDQVLGGGIQKKKKPSRPAQASGGSRNAIQNAAADSTTYTVAPSIDPGFERYPSITGGTQPVDLAKTGQPMMSPYASSSNLQHMSRDPTGDGQYIYPDPPAYSHPQASCNGREHQYPATSNPGGNTSNPLYIDGEGSNSSYQGRYMDRNGIFIGYGQEYVNPSMMPDHGFGQYLQQQGGPRPETTQMQPNTNGSGNLYMNTQMGQVHGAFQNQNVGQVGLGRGAPSNLNRGVMQSVYQQLPTPNTLQSGPKLQQISHHLPNTTKSSTNQGNRDIIARTSAPNHGLRHSANSAPSSTKYNQSNRPSHQGTTGAPNPRNVLRHMKDMANKGNSATTVSTINPQAVPSTKPPGSQNTQPLPSSKPAAPSSKPKRVRDEFDFPEFDEKLPPRFDFLAGPRASLASTPHPEPSTPRPDSSKKIEAVENQSGGKRKHQGEEPIIPQVSAGPAGHGSNGHHRSNPHKRQKLHVDNNDLAASRPCFESSKNVEGVGSQSEGKRKQQGEEPSTPQLSAGGGSGSNDDHQSNPHERQKLPGDHSDLVSTPRFETSEKVEAETSQSAGKRKRQGEEPSTPQVSIGGTHGSTVDQQSNPHKRQKLEDPKAMKMLVAGGQGSISGSQQPSIQKAATNAEDSRPTPQKQNIQPSQDNTQRSPATADPQSQAMPNQPTAQMRVRIFNVLNMASTIPPNYDAELLQIYRDSAKGRSPEQMMEEHVENFRKTEHSQGHDLTLDQRRVFGERIAEVRKSAATLLKSSLTTPQSSKQPQQSGDLSQVDNHGLPQSVIPLAEQTLLYNKMQEDIGRGSRGGIGASTLKQPVPQQSSHQRVDSASMASQPSQRQTPSNANTAAVPPAYQAIPKAQPTPRMNQGAMSSSIQGRSTENGAEYIPQTPVNTTRPTSTPQHAQVNGHGVNHVQPSTGYMHNPMHNPNIARPSTAPPSVPTNELDQLANWLSRENAAPVQHSTTQPISAPNTDSSIGVYSSTKPTTTPKAGSLMGVLVPNMQPSAIQQNSQTLPTPKAGPQMDTRMPGSMQPPPNQQKYSSQLSTADMSVNKSWTGQAPYSSPYSHNGQTGSQTTIGQPFYPSPRMPDPTPAPTQSKKHGKPSHQAKNGALIDKPGKAQAQGAKKPSPASTDSNRNQTSTPKTVSPNPTASVPSPDEKTAFLHLEGAVFHEHFTFPGESDGWTTQLNHVHKEYKMLSSKATVYITRPTFLGGVTFPTIITTSRLTLPGCVLQQPEAAPVPNTTAAPPVAKAPQPADKLPSVPNTAAPSVAKTPQPAGVSSIVPNKLAPPSLAKTKAPKPKVPKPAPYIPCIVNAPMKKPKPIDYTKVHKTPTKVLEPVSSEETDAAQQALEVRARYEDTAAKIEASTEMNFDEKLEAMVQNSNDNWVPTEEEDYLNSLYVAEDADEFFGTDNYDNIEDFNFHAPGLK